MSNNADALPEAIQFVVPGGWRTHLVDCIGKLTRRICAAPSDLHATDHDVIITITERKK